MPDNGPDGISDLEPSTTPESPGQEESSVSSTKSILFWLVFIAIFILTVGAIALYLGFVFGISKKKCDQSQQN